MTKKDFLRKLNRELKKLQKPERSRYISYYDEIISDMMDGGMTENEAVEKQGNISDIAKEILKDVDESKLVKRDRIGIVLICTTIILAVASVICIIALPEAGAISLMRNDGGSTAVFVAGKIKEPIALYLVAACIAFVCTIYFAVKRKLSGIIVGTVAILCIGMSYMLVDKLGKPAPNNTKADTKTEESYDRAYIEALTEEIIVLLDAEDYKTLQEKYASDEMKSYMTKEVIEEAKSAVGNNWGQFVSNGNIYSGDVTQNGEYFIIVQVNTMYENVSVTYTITFDEDMRVAGLFMK